MYLKTCTIQNMGPIDHASVELEFNENGTPKPLVLVGRNGTGKSVLLSSVVDALIEFAKLAFQNVVKGQALGNSPYFKVVGGRTMRSGASFGVALLRFSAGERDFLYVEKSGALDSSEYLSQASEQFSQLCDWEIDDNVKRIEADKDEARKEFLRSAICYFPTGRHERPHWLNSESLDLIRFFEFSPRFEGRLGKPLVVQSSTAEIKEWVLNVLVDSLVDVDFQLDSTSNQYIPRTRSDLQQAYTYGLARQNIDAILKEVVQDEEASMMLAPRIASDSRLRIRMSSGIDIPSLDHLSSGQASLFNMFCTILRYAEHEDLSRSVALDEIEGLVVIDEVDAQAHTDLQYQVIPRLMRLFPKVQFIITTHSPLVLLGLERTYGSEGIQIIEMPNGQPISTERFSEFERSWDYYKKTTSYERDVQRSILDGSKPLVLVEGTTDAKYVRTALEIFDRRDLLDSIELRSVGNEGADGARNAGVPGLNNAARLLETNPGFTNRRILLLYDSDSNKPPSDADGFSVRILPVNHANTRIRRGVENLFPENLFEERFYSVRKETGHYGEQKVIPIFLKVEFCNWICTERRMLDDFTEFGAVIELIDGFLSQTATADQ